jgi:hypothetical protein
MRATSGPRSSSFGELFSLFHSYRDWELTLLFASRGGCCTLCLLFAYFMVPETKGLSLEQVDRMLEETSPRNSAKWVPHNTFAASHGKVGEKGEVEHV